MVILGTLYTPMEQRTRSVRLTGARIVLLDPSLSYLPRYYFLLLLYTLVLSGLFGLSN